MHTHTKYILGRACCAVLVVLAVLLPALARGAEAPPSGDVITTPADPAKTAAAAPETVTLSDETMALLARTLQAINRGRAAIERGTPRVVVSSAEAEQTVLALRYAAGQSARLLEFWRSALEEAKGQPEQLERTLKLAAQEAAQIEVIQAQLAAWEARVASSAH